MVDFKKLVLAFMPIVASQLLLLRNQPAFAAEQHGIQPEFQIAAGIHKRRFPAMTAMNREGHGKAKTRRFCGISVWL